MSKGSLDQEQNLCLANLVAVCVEAATEAAKLIQEVKESGYTRVQSEAAVDKASLTEDEFLKKQKQMDINYAKVADNFAQEIIVKYLNYHFPEMMGVNYFEDKNTYSKLEKHATIANLREKVDNIDYDKKNEDVYRLAKEKLESINPYDDIDLKEIFIWIDPLDGRRDFLKAKIEQTHATVLIGIAYKGKPIIGVITQPFFYDKIGAKTGKYRVATVWGIYGIGIYHNRYDVADPENIIAEILDNPKNNNQETDSEKFSSYLREYRVVISKNNSTDELKNLFKKPGLDLYSCSGCGYKVILMLDNRVDIYVHPSEGLKRWDSCAPDAILRTLGGKCTDITGEDFDYSQNVKDHYHNCGIVMTLSESAHKHFIDLLMNENMIEKVKAGVEKMEEEKEKVKDE